MNQSEGATCAVSTQGNLPEEPEEPPSSPSRHPNWKHVPLEQWEDWRWQMQNAVRTTSQLIELLPHSPADVRALQSLETQYKLAIPPYYFSLMDVADPDDPIRRQSVPSPLEMSSQTGLELEDPLEEDKDSPVPGLTHRYPDRALLVTTHVCSMYCRFCTRKRVTMDRDGWDAPSHNDQRMIDYVRQHPEIHDVIVSGGDPLSLPVSKLRWFVTSLAEIPHVDMIRLGTRVPVTLPQRLFDQDLVEMLGRAGKIWIQTHFNHPREITPETTRAVRALVNAGMPVNNHAVLLKGVNDSVATMRELVRGLLRIKVRPYYLFHCDPVVGAGHFRTSVWKGIEIIEGLRGHVSGLGVPTYVVDGLHGAGKIPLMPNYLVSASENAVVLRNYEGMIFRYAPEDRLEAKGEGYPSLGVSQLLSGSQQPLIPAGTPRIIRREKRAAAELANACASSELVHLGTLASPAKAKATVAADSVARNGVAKNGVAKNGSGAQNGHGAQNGRGAQNGHGTQNGQASENGGPGKNGIAAKNGSVTKNGSTGKNGSSTKNGSDSVKEKAVALPKPTAAVEVALQGVVVSTARRARSAAKANGQRAVAALSTTVSAALAEVPTGRLVARRATATSKRSSTGLAGDAL